MYRHTTVYEEYHVSPSRTAGNTEPDIYGSMNDVIAGNQGRDTPFVVHKVVKTVTIAAVFNVDHALPAISQKYTVTEQKYTGTRYTVSMERMPMRNGT